MFTSFLFEPAFDVVNLERKSVHGLGSWETKVTATTPEDIGRHTTEILLAQPRIANEIIYVAGETISYGQLAEVIERFTGHTFEKTLWTLDKLRTDLAAAPDDGMWWDKSRTYNARHGHETMDVEGYLRARLRQPAFSDS